MDSNPADSLIAPVEDPDLSGPSGRGLLVLFLLGGWG